MCLVLGPGLVPPGGPHRRAGPWRGAAKMPPHGLVCVSGSRRGGNDAPGPSAGSGRRAPAGARPWQPRELPSVGVLLLSTLKHGLGKGRRGGTSVARCQSRFAWPSRSSLLLLLPAPSNALKSHFQARHRINLWALHIAGSAKQDVGSFFSLSLRLG